MKNKTNIDSKTIQLSAICVFLFVVMSFLRPRFMDPTNIHSMLMQMGTSGLFALCIAIAYLSRGIDLSIIAIGNLVGILSGIVFRTRLTETSGSGEVALVILLCVGMGLLVGLICGLLNGFLIAELGIFPILVTLATQNIFMGISMILTQGRAETAIPKALINLGDASLLPLGAFKGLPLVFLLFLVIFIVLTIVVHKTPYGFKLQWYGSNSRVSFFNAIDNKRVVYTTYMLSGMVAALGGMVILSRTGSAKADYGPNMVFQSLLTCVLAGISPLGGRGKMYNLILSLCALQFLSTGFNMMRVSPLIRDSLYGFLLVISIVIEYVVNKRKINKLNRAAVRQEAAPSP